MMGLPGFSLERDDWLSGLLGRPAFRVLTKRQSIADFPPGNFFATAKVAASEVTSAERLEDAGFRIVDTALTFTARAAEIPAQSGFELCLARSDDRASVGAIAREAFRFSRFHLDPSIPDAVARKIKATWAENFFDGRRGDAMIVAMADGELAGFLLLLRAPSDRLVIDLIAVQARFRGRGIARAMIGWAAATMPAAEFVVGTQAANTPSVRLYESLGFRLSNAQLVLHCHGGNREYPT
jgi:ribosomal protein S18 acetylase RimI-like enzyme